MTTARKEIIDLAVTRWYHCISKCVRGGCLLANHPPAVVQADTKQTGDTQSGVIQAHSIQSNASQTDATDADNGADFDRKQWIEDRLEFLTQHYAVAVGGFAILDNHLHVLTRIDPDIADAWTPAEVIRRWMAIYPPSRIDLDNPKIVANWIAAQIQKPNEVQKLRERLISLSWFMKSLKEPIARIANQIDGCTGAFWAARFKSIAILDTEALLATNVYIDLNVFAAGLCPTPEASPHTSIYQRVEHAAAADKLDNLAAAELGSVAGSQAAGEMESDLWLIPIEDRRPGTAAFPTSDREGMHETFSLGSYLLLLDYTSRLLRDGKAALDARVAGIFERLGTSREFWNTRVCQLLRSRQLRGTFFASDPTRVRQLSAAGGKRRANISPQMVPVS